MATQYLAGNRYENSFRGLLVVCLAAWRRRWRRAPDDAHPAENTEARPLKSRRIFVTLVEEIVDPRKDRHAASEIVVGREVHHEIRIGIETLNGKAAVPAISVALGSRETMRGELVIASPKSDHPEKAGLRTAP